jgi:hypothetical protein
LITTPADSSVTASKLGSLAVTGAKLNTDVISAQTELAVEPADADEFMVSDGGVLKRIDYSLIKGGGITEADEWRVHTAFDQQSGTITNNWERNDTDFGLIGTGMTESSGVFTFPATGIYRVEFNLAGYKSSAQVRYAQGDIEVSTDSGSSFADRARAYSSISDDDTAYASITCSCIVDVTNASTFRVRFGLGAELTVTWEGSSTMNRTFASFIKLGDT